MSETKGTLLPFQIFLRLEESSGELKLGKIFRVFKHWSEIASITVSLIEFCPIVFSYGIKQGNGSVTCDAIAGLLIKGEIDSTLINSTVADKGGMYSLCKYVAEEFGQKNICYGLNNRFADLEYAKGKLKELWHSGSPFNFGGALASPAGELKSEIEIDDLIKTHHTWMQEERCVLDMWISTAEDKNTWTAMGFYKEGNSESPQLFSEQLISLTFHIQESLAPENLHMVFNNPTDFYVGHDKLN